MPLGRLTCLLALLGLVTALALAGCQRGTLPVTDVLPEEPSPPAAVPLKYKDHNLVFVSFDALQAAHVGAARLLRATSLPPWTRLPGRVQFHTDLLGRVVDRAGVDDAGSPASIRPSTA